MFLLVFTIIENITKKYKKAEHKKNKQEFDPGSE